MRLPLRRRLFIKRGMLKLILPPNLKDAAERDAIAVRLELDLQEAPAPALLPSLALLQRWCGPGKPPSFLQLSRTQLEELASLLSGHPVFFMHGNPGLPLPWVDGRPLGLPKAPPPVAAASANLKPTQSTQQKRVSSGTPGRMDGSEHYLSISLPSRDHASYQPLLDLLKQSGFLLEPSNRCWWLRDRHKTLRFLAEHGRTLREEWGVVPSERFLTNTPHIREAELVCSAEESRAGFSLTMSLRAGSSSASAVNAALASETGYVESQGTIYLLDSRLRGRLMEAQRALSGEKDAPLAALRSFRVSAEQVPEAQDLLEELSPNFQPPSAWRERSTALRSTSCLPPARVPESFDQLLRPYQRLGLAWLNFLRTHSLGGILADEMGLGKTLQALGLIVTLSTEGSTCPCLVVAPASLLENWRREAARFASTLRVFVHHGQNRLQGRDQLRGLHLVITSYGTLTRDKDLFSELEFSVLIADEAQHIKNRRSQNARALRTVPAKTRFVLTGTPLENSLEDLRALFEFLLPGYLTPIPAGLRSEDRAWHDERLLARTAPYILRRTKSAVAPELPPRIEQTLWCEMSPEQSALYRKLQQDGERELLDLETGGAGEARLRFAMLTQLLRLRQICCDPRLLGGASEETPSAKSALLAELLDEALDDGHRVLVFSQFTSMLDLIAGSLEAEGIAFCRLDGSMNTSQRQAAVDRFQAGAAPVFLLSLKAGGTGLNLTAADTVVHFDPWWNPAAEAQATDRAHRLGQTRTVTSYKLICSGTVEEKVLALQEQKRALLANVFEASDKAAEKLSLGDLRALLS